MFELRLPLDFPSSIPLRQRRRLKGRGCSFSSPSSSSSSSASSPVLSSWFVDLICSHPLCSPSVRRKIVAADSTSSSWNVEEEGRPNEGNGELYLLGSEGLAPASIELETVSGEEHFDRIIAEAQQLEVPVVVVWMANWCRKCIYLKPKLEKMAIEFYPRIRFYCVDVNAVPHKLVKRAGITKMPTIQLWRDSMKQDEVIGGHKAWLVINEVRQMLEEVP